MLLTEATASDAPLTEGRMVPSARGEDIEALGKLDLSAINLNSSRLTFLEESSLGNIKPEDHKSSPRSHPILIRE